RASTYVGAACMARESAAVESQCEETNMSIEAKVSAERRLQMIAEAAYFRAEERGFHGGDPVTDWVDAEAEVDTRIRQMEYEHLLERLETCVATATKSFDALKRKVSGAAAGARAEWRDDV